MVGIDVTGCTATWSAAWGSVVDCTRNGVRLALTDTVAASSPAVASLVILTVFRFGFLGADVTDDEWTRFVVVDAESLPPTTVPTAVLPSVTFGAVVSCPVDSPTAPLTPELEVVASGEAGEVSDGDAEGVPSAHAAPGVVATATPTPNATANPPTRPMCFA
ncbi:hypothetical protein [Mycobacterium sp. OAE908]|uniref:hypothetical protein n=1 Tax=Mycobacterium sp. OAE908 TaxID=2817899 RepID=UPI001AE18956